VDQRRDDVIGSDEDLLAAWRAGDVKQGELLWHRHSRSVQRFFRNKVPWAVATDLAQRTLEHGLRLQQPVRSFRSYLLGIAKHQLFDYLRAEQRKKRREADLDTLVIDDMVASPEEWVCAKREKRVLLHALRRLPLPIQLVLELRYWERMSDREIADVLAVPIGTVKSRIAAGRVGLRAAIEQLVSSHERLQSTLDSLEKWASRTQAPIDR
jgi:RNA polymerase sigma-70 factor (ECF subfamily)